MDNIIYSQLSAIALITIPSEIYSYGSTYMFMISVVVIGSTLLINWLYLPVFYNNNIDNCYAVSSNILQIKVLIWILL